MRYLNNYQGTLGFTLIEILAAFSIASVAMAIIFQIFAKGTTATILSKGYTHATTIAESRLALIGTAEPFENYLTSGIENDLYHWQVSVSEYIPHNHTANEPRIQLMAVTITVTWDGRGKTRRITLKTLKPVFPT